MTVKEERKFYRLFMGEDCCLPDEDGLEDATLEECEDMLWIYQDLLREAIKKQDRRDINHCKKQLQEVKTSNLHLEAK